MRKRGTAKTLELSVLENPHVAYSGKPMTSLHCRWVSASGTVCTGYPCVDSLIGEMALPSPEPGDTIIVTVSIVKGGSRGRQDDD